jgi:DNA-binding NtrC family response regulator
MIPPLRQRKEDIPALVHHLIDRKSTELKLTERPVLASGAIDRLIAYDWPGNVRELENMIERALIRHRGGVLSFEALLPALPAGEAVQKPRANPPCLLEELNARH